MLVVAGHKGKGAGSATEKVGRPVFNQELLYTPAAAAAAVLLIGWCVRFTPAAWEIAAASSRAASSSTLVRMLVWREGTWARAGRQGKQHGCGNIKCELRMLGS